MDLVDKLSFRLSDFYSCLSIADFTEPLARIFNTSNAKVLDFLLTNKGLVCTEEQISKLTAIPSRTLQRSLQSLLHEDMIKRNRRKGRVFYYETNLAVPRVSGLLSYINSTMLENLESMKPK